MKGKYSLYCCGCGRALTVNGRFDTADDAEQLGFHLMILLLQHRQDCSFYLAKQTVFTEALQES